MSDRPGSKESNRRQSRLDELGGNETPVRSRSNSVKRGASNSRGRPQHTTGAQTRSQSTKSNPTNSKQKTDPLSAIRKYQRAMVLDQKRTGGSHVSTSTPVGSPKSTKEQQNEAQSVVDDATSTYISTPLVGSAGTALVSNPATLLPIEDNCSLDELIAFIDSIAIHINHYGNNMTLDSNWKSNFYSRYITISTSLGKARMIALDRQVDVALKRCSDLSALLDEHKLKLSLKCTSDSNLSSFHGFPSLVENSGTNLDALGIKPIPESAHQLNKIIERIKALEVIVPGINTLRSQQPAIAERVAILEAHETLNLNSRLIILENSLKRFPSSDVFDDLINRVSVVEAETKDLMKPLIDENKSLKSSLEALLREFSTFKNNTAIEIESLRQALTMIQTINLSQEQTVPVNAQPNGISNIQGASINTKEDIFHRTASWINSQANATYRSVNGLIMNDELSNNNCQTGNPKKPMDSEQYYPSHPVSKPMIYPTRSNKNMVPSNVGSSKKSDDASVISSNSGTNSPIAIQGKLMRSNVNGLRRLISSDPSKISKCTLSDIYKNQLGTIDSQCKEIQRSMHHYMKIPMHDIALCEEVANVIDLAINWTSQIRTLYHSLGIHKRSQASKLYDSLPKFSRHSDITVFEFFRRFSAYTEDFDIPEEKAELLYNKFLSPSIKDEVSEYKHDYDTIKRMLTHRYGDLKTLTTDILSSVSKLTKPNRQDDSITCLEYYRTLNSALQRINNLLSSDDIPQDEAKEYIFSQDFLHLLLSYMPYDAKSKFVDKMQMMDEDTVRIRGKPAFKLLINSVNLCYQSYDTAARTEAPPGYEMRKNKAKVVKIHSVSTETKSNSEFESDNERELPISSVNFQNKSVSAKPVSQLKFPCILDGHKHQISECREFFFKSPKERIEERKKFAYRHCLVCLQSSDSCNHKKCSNIDHIPYEMVCKECKKISKTNPRRSVYSVLFCFNPQHTKPSNIELLKAIENYVPGFNSDNLKAPVNIASHFQVLAGLKPKVKPSSLSKKPDLLEPVPVFNTFTGEKDNPRTVDIIPEIKHDSIGVMQFLNIKGKTVLCLYDRGANQHLVEGKIAEEIGMKVTGTEPSAIGVVSGGKIWTEYGTYQMIIGPTPAGKYHEIEAQGMQTITTKVPSYDLTTVNNETREHANIPGDSPLPEYIGSERIGLLIGLKSPELEPECVFTLPSGIGLYKAPFKDVFGSYYCYGGPHYSFTEINQKFHGNVNHFNIYFTEVYNQYKNSLYPSLLTALKPEVIDNDCALSEYKEANLPYSFSTSSGETYFPTPLDSQTFKELGQEVEDEKLPDSYICPRLHCQCFTTSIFKAKVPLKRLKTFVDENDKDDTINFRCDKCKLCKCATSNTNKMMSLNEKIEQQIIEESVSVNLNEKKVYVDLPFVKPADKFLADKHGGNNNYKQAEKVYKTQCKASDEVKSQIKEAQKDLVSKGFMKKLEALPQEQQDQIRDSPFQHFMPWRYVMKDSASTPLRLVVDPSMSGLNQCLAKGENKMKRIPDILNRARFKKHIWTSDISKLYNRLHLKPSSYRYQLFLFGDDLHPDKTPDIYVMLVAWYGVSSSANQASFALEELARLLKDKYPLAYIVIIMDTYVDDMIGGAHTLEECLEQIEQVLKVLEAGGFSVKYVICSGQSGIEETIKVLGYKWNISDDTLAPGFTEINFNDKKRGLKIPNPFPASTPEDVSNLLASKDVTRRMAISMIAQFWEPTGIWEPYKLQLKLDAQGLSGINWDTPLSPEMQDYWISRFQEFLDLPNLSVPRYILPNDSTPTKIRLLCISDAAEFAGGGAIYAGVELPGGEYSCKLLTSKSRLMSSSIPRNELEAIRITAALAYDVKCSLGDSVDQVLYFTDSSIAMSWCHNTKKRLRLFCLNRMMEIRRLIEAVVGKQDSLPLFHIDGTTNPADMITKPSSLKPKDLSKDSVWISGYSWMKQPLNLMPKTTYEDLQLSAVQNQLHNEECFPEVPLPSLQASSVLITQTDNEVTHCSGCLVTNGNFVIEACFGISDGFKHCIDCSCTIVSHSFAAKAGRVSSYIIDVIKYGFMKSIKIVSRVLDFVWSIKHKVHIKQGLKHLPACRKCMAIDMCGGLQPEYLKVLNSEAFNYFLRCETADLVSKCSKDKLKNFHLKNGIMYAQGRIPADAEVNQKDLNFDVFFDGDVIRGVLPVVSAESDLFFSLLLHIHHKVRKHAGNEATLNEVMRYVFPINNPRRVIQLVRKNCPRCRMILRKTLELEIGQHPQSRYQIVPAFYHSMCDIVYGFKSKPFKNSRGTRSQSEVKVYALVIVCLLTSATSIMVLEGLETQDVIMALERHSSRHGVPSCLFVDQGTQLTNLDKVTLNLRNANLELRHSLGIDIRPSTAKSHMERGRVERKIRTLREMLLKSAINTQSPLTPMQWETVFCKMASEIDDIPLARADRSSSADLGWDILTPNRFKLGMSHNRVLQGPMRLTEQSCPTQLLRRIEDIQRYWYLLLLERIHHLIPKPCSMSKTDEVKVDDIVVFRFKDNSNSKLEQWKVGRIVDILKQGRGVLISYPNTIGTKVSMRFVERSPRDICIISSVSDINLNSREFFQQIKLMQ